MDSRSGEIAHDFPPFFRIHSTGHVERYLEHDFLPPSHDIGTGVVSRDVIVSPENNVSVRIYLPKTSEGGRKIPLVVYIHGGAFTIQSAFSSLYHNYVNSLASESGSIIVSIEYRLAPEHPLPACYDDCYAVMKWIESHARDGEGSDPWLSEHADLERIYVAGDSAGANLAHNMVILADELDDIKFVGLILIHPYFGLKSDKLWNHICPDKNTFNEFRRDPSADVVRWSRLGCDRVLVCIAEKDQLRKMGWNYSEGLKNTDWKGVVELYETPGEEHVFHLLDQTGENATLLMKKIVSFVKFGRTHVMSHF